MFIIPLFPGLTRRLGLSRGWLPVRSGVTADMIISPGRAAMQSAQVQTASVDSMRQMISGIQEMFAGMQSRDNVGTICIPVYVGGTLLDEVVVNAQARQNLRSGGR